MEITCLNCKKNIITTYYQIVETKPNPKTGKPLLCLASRCPDCNTKVSRILQHTTIDQSEQIREYLKTKYKHPEEEADALHSLNLSNPDTVQALVCAKGQITEEQLEQYMNEEDRTLLNDLYQKETEEISPEQKAMIEELLTDEQLEKLEDERTLN